MTNCHKEFPPTTVGLGIFLILGTFVAYAPQLIRFCRTRTHVGMSFIMLFITNLNNAAGVVESVLQQWGRATCCVNTVGAFQCFKLLIVSIQLFFIWMMVFLIYCFALFFYQDGNDPQLIKKKFYVQAFFLLNIVLSSLSLIIGVILVVELGHNSYVVQAFAYANGVAFTFGPILVWVPQIYTTWRLKSPGSLSLVMMAIVTIGAFITAVFQGPLSGEWAISSSGFLGGLQQIVLTVLLAWYTYKEWKFGKQQKAHDEIADIKSFLEESSHDYSSDEEVEIIGEHHIQEARISVGLPASSPSNYNNYDSMGGH